MEYTTYQVAKMTGITVRTLRYYDQIGLLRPSGYGETRHRFYDADALETLQQILFFRELEFPLAKIAEIIQSPAFDRQKALEMQMDFLEKKAERYQKLSRLAFDTLCSMRGERTMENYELFDGFDTEKMLAEQKQYEEEVRNRWDSTEAYKVSRQRSSSYTKEDWIRINEAQQANMNTLVDCFTEEMPVDSARVQEVVENARLHIDRYFYPCPPEMMSGLGEMYIDDPRFKETYDKMGDGLAQYYHDAIQVYYRRYLERQKKG